LMSGATGRRESEVEPWMANLSGRQFS